MRCLFFDWLKAVPGAAWRCPSGVAPVAAERAGKTDCQRSEGHRIATGGSSVMDTVADRVQPSANTKMKNTKSKYQTREQWLAAAIALMEPLFKKAGYELPKVRVSCGFPSVRAMSRSKYRAGECWSGKSAEDGKCQIFISPRERKPETKDGVLSILVHEAVHAAVGLEAKHGKVFRKCALAVGLEGKMTSTISSDNLVVTFREWVKKLGDYPHAALKPGARAEKKQTTRMVKCECKECGYSVRTSRKWLEQAGAPECPCNHEPMTFEIPKELKDDGGDND